ncbi:MAG: flavin reductase [Neisseriaceae bacterium]|nr:flavin reductase [Neisseriaceae bacterium]
MTSPSYPDDLATPQDLAIETHRQAFRNAMAQLSAAVNILTTSGPEGDYGITMTAICSVTDTPPTILACINGQSTLNGILRAQSDVCVNILGSHQQDMANHFSGRTGLNMSERFATEGWHQNAHGQWYVAGAVAHLSGKVSDLKEVGTHTVFLIELHDIQFDDAPEALVYFDRQYQGVAKQAK